MFEARKHSVTGEPAFQYVDWTPADLPDRENLGVNGRPLRSFIVCADRVEIVPAWCFSSGHAEWYEDGATEVVRRDDDAAQAELARRFGDPIAAEIARAFAKLG